MQQDVRDFSIHHSHEQKHSFRNEVLVADLTAGLQVTKFRVFHSKKTTKFGKTELYIIPMDHTIKTHQWRGELHGFLTIM
jgi:hypothetical protein